MKKVIGCVVGVIGLVGVDWFTKYLAQVHLGDKRIPIIGEFLQLRYVLNTGLSFSRFAGNKWVPMLMPVIAMVAVVAAYFYIRNYFKKRKEEKAIDAMNIVFVLLIAGFVGNYGDRIVHGGVIDFISVKGFAVFNVADIYVTICQVLGIIMVIYQCLKESKEKKEKKKNK